MQSVPFLWPTLETKRLNGVSAQELRSFDSSSGAAPLAGQFMETDGQGGWRLVTLEEIIKRQPVPLPLPWQMTIAMRKSVPILFPVPTRIYSIVYRPSLSLRQKAHLSVAIEISGDSSGQCGVSARVVERDCELSPLAELLLYQSDEGNPIELTAIRELPSTVSTLDILLWNTGTEGDACYSCSSIFLRESLL